MKMEYILLGIIIVVIRILLFFIYRKNVNPSKKKRYFLKKQTNINEYTSAEKISKILKTEYTTKPIMYKGEFRVYCELQELLSKKFQDKYTFRVFPQIILGCFIENADNNIKYLRADFVIINQSGFPIIVVEYQGDGHYNSNDFLERDRRKRIACENAGIRLIEVPSDFGKKYLEDVSEILQNYINKYYN